MNCESNLLITGQPCPKRDGTEAAFKHCCGTDCEFLKGFMRDPVVATYHIHCSYGLRPTITMTDDEEQAIEAACEVLSAYIDECDGAEAVDERERAQAIAETLVQLALRGK